MCSMKKSKEYLPILRSSTLLSSAMKVGISTSLFVTSIHLCFHLISGVNAISNGLSWGVRPYFSNELAAFYHSRPFRHTIEYLGFPLTDFGFIPNSIMYGTVIGTCYFYWLRYKRRRIRWRRFKPLAPFKTPSLGITENAAGENFCRLRVTSCCLMPVLRDARHRVYYFDPNDLNRTSCSRQVARTRCLLCRSEIWHTNAWPETTDIPTAWKQVLRDY